MWFAAPFGLHALYGTTTQKVSDDLDGVFNQIDATQDISSGQALINGMLVQCFLFKYNDPTGATPALRSGVTTPESDTIHYSYGSVTEWTGDS